MYFSERLRFIRLVSRDWENVLMLSRQFPYSAQIFVDFFMSCYPGELVIPPHIVSEIHAIATSVNAVLHEVHSRRNSLRTDGTPFYSSIFPTEKKQIGPVSEVSVDSEVSRQACM